MLETIWFLLWGVLWAVYFALDGFDLGMGMLKPFLARNEFEKRVIYNAAGPFWDGNEVWLIAAGGVTFAAFPLAYAAMFSGLYTALMLLLFALIIRGVSFEFRSKIDSPGWKAFWDGCQTVGSFLPALLLGVAFANIFKGLPLDQNQIMHGGVIDLLNPYGLAGGVLFVLLFLVHGALWLTIKAEGDLRERAAATAAKLWPVLAGVIVLFLAYTFVATKLFDNYFLYPALFLILVLPVGGLVLTRVFLAARKFWLAWGASAVLIIGTTLFGVVGLFPALLPSSLNPAWSLTATDAGIKASSSPLTLAIMLGVALVFVPIVLGYQFWVYKTFSFPVTQEDLEY